MVDFAALRANLTLQPCEWLRVLPPATRLIFQGGADARAAAARAWAPGFSDIACRAQSDGRNSSLWLGPDEFLLLAPLDDPTAAVSAAFSSLQEALAGIAHSLVDVSHRQSALQIQGPDCEKILSGGCPLDLDLAAFPVGMCTRTLFAKADITLWRTQESVFHIEIWRSFFGYLTGLLAEVARE